MMCYSACLLHHSTAVTRLVYVREIEFRVDGRSGLGIGLRARRLSLLGLFNVRDMSELDTLEADSTN